MSVPHSASPLLVCIVVYFPDRQYLSDTLSSLLRASRSLPGGIRLVIVDNGGGEAAIDNAALERDFPSMSWLGGQGNIGFGAGHNLGLLSAQAPFALVLNPDVRMDESALLRALEFMAQYPDCALLSPSSFGEDGEQQYLCKRYPSLFGLFLRGFAPSCLRRRFSRYLARYEMREVAQNEILWDPPIVSGCFMLFRKAAFDAIGGFDERFFLYFEDFDISLRVAGQGRIAYVPQVRIIHQGGHAAHKGWQHIRMFMASAYRFFHIHGWKWL